MLFRSSISATEGAKIAYTIDGTTPSASSTAVDNGTAIALPEGDYTMKMALIEGGRVWGLTERQYSIKSFKPYQITINVNNDQVGWTEMNVWSWGGDGSHATTATAWPGDKMTTTQELGGKQWYTLTYTMNTNDDYVNFVFNANDGKDQTENVQNVNQTSFFEITAAKDENGHRKVQNVTSQYVSAISTPVCDNAATTLPQTLVTSLDGRTIRRFTTHVPATNATQGLPHGIYIVDGKKIAK